MNTASSPPKGIILNLAWLDLRHEWILTLCMMLAIAAVLSPLLILMGLKYGTIQTLRDQLVEDPVNREVRPMQTEQLSPEWFARVSERPDVGFALPTILRGSSIARVNAPSGKSLVIDLVPTAQGDPLILDNEGRIPESGECVLSSPAAKELKIQEGEILHMIITRTRNHQRESEELDLRVTAILNERADGLPRLYAPRKLVEDIETYREGFSVAARDWPGGRAEPYVSFDGVRVITPKPLERLVRHELAINTGFVEIEELDSSSFNERQGIDLPTGMYAYELRTRGNTVQISSLRQVQGKLRGYHAIILPFTKKITFQSEGISLNVVGLSVTNEQAERLGIPPLPWGGFEKKFTDEHVRQILLPPSEHNASSTIPLDIVLENGDHLEIPVIDAGTFNDRDAVVPIELLGILRTGSDRNLGYDPAKGGLFLGKSGYRGFRLYARSIDDVPVLHEWFIDQGISVQTNAREISQVQALDHGLTRIFWLIAMVGIVGGMASLVANLYAAVERKKRDISVLRLMGISRLQVFRFPIYQGLIMAVISVFIAMISYAVFELIINRAFSDDLGMGQKICTLPLPYFAWALGITSSIAFLSSLLAAWKATMIDPAEALREE